MSGDRLTQQWGRGDITLGGWLLSADTLVAATVGSLGFDYVGIDEQHGAATASTVPDLVAALGQQTTPVVRVRENNAAVIGRALDAGALGVIVPLVESAEQAEAAVTACRYPPRGRRSFGPARARLVHGADYGAVADDLVACIPMIETAAGLANVEQIMAVPGVDAVYVGPADLSLSLGLSPLLDHAEAAFTEALTTITAAARRHGVVAGVHASARLAHRRLEQGFTMVTVGVDQAVLAAALSEGLDVARDAARVLGSDDR